MSNSALYKGSFNYSTEKMLLIVANLLVVLYSSIVFIFGGDTFSSLFLLTIIIVAAYLDLHFRENKNIAYLFKEHIILEKNYIFGLVKVTHKVALDSNEIDSLLINVRDIDTISFSQLNQQFNVITFKKAKN
ncbi:hypothetical protein ACQCVK_10660 [Rossellomorea vietnamensis]|uniref:hypothetical protein n=1 Tax=Rossellomorea vietnamensis TaxID=218284 RepID=UPI003CF283D7